jgi:hypothetical protein
MVRNENSSASFLVKDAPHQKRPEVWGMSPSSTCESWKSSGSHHGIMQTAAVTRHRLVDQQFSGPIPVPLGQALAVAPSEMARSKALRASATTRSKPTWWLCWRLQSGQQPSYDIPHPGMALVRLATLVPIHPNRE